MMKLAWRQALAGYLLDDSGQSLTEYILIIGLISVPIFALFKVLMQNFLKEFISRVINSFTRG
ncbi:MAG TPA: hypothetical protein VHL58_08925 [Thermoanaerobaculia bacterium]|nr:hypothetical protein [Thermoanaerobaculia bacterium]